MEVVKDYTLSVEYVESRQDKLRGRGAFQGKVVTTAVRTIKSGAGGEADTAKLKIKA